MDSTNQPLEKQQLPWVLEVHDVGVKNIQSSPFSAYGGFLGLYLSDHCGCVITRKAYTVERSRTDTNTHRVPSEDHVAQLHIWHWVIVLSRVEQHSPASHLPSVGCFRISCWDLAPSWLTLMCTKRVGGLSLPHSLSPVTADGCFCWRMDGVYVQCQWRFMCWKPICCGRHLWVWEQEFHSLWISGRR